MNCSIGHLYLKYKRASTPPQGRRAGKGSLGRAGKGSLGHRGHRSLTGRGNRVSPEPEPFAAAASRFTSEIGAAAESGSGARGSRAALGGLGLRTGVRWRCYQWHCCGFWHWCAEMVTVVFTLLFTNDASICILDIGILRTCEFQTWPRFWKSLNVSANILSIFVN